MCSWATVIALIFVILSWAAMCAVLLRKVSIGSRVVCYWSKAGPRYFLPSCREILIHKAFKVKELDHCFLCGLKIKWEE